MDKLRIGAIDYSVKRVKRLWDKTHNSGEIHYFDSEIILDKSLDKQQTRQTLWHEIIHAVLFNGSYNDHDEQMVQIISNGIVQVLRDNPELRGE